MNYLLTAIKGFAMGASDIVPGVSGGTVALIFGIYERLVANVYGGAQVLFCVAKLNFSGAWDKFKAIEWGFMLPLAVGLLGAIAALTSIIETQLKENPEEIAGLFFGLVVASIVVAIGMFKRNAQSSGSLTVIALASGVLFFYLLGFSSGPAVDPSLLFFFVAGSIAICAMILPGISGSFILLMMGMYAAVLDAVHDLDLASLGVFAVGAVVGLALFSTLLQRLLAKYHDLVLALLIGLMIGSLRVLWPWPNGVGIISEEADESISGVGLEWPEENFAVPVLLAIVAFVVVVAVARFAKAEEVDA